MWHANDVLTRPEVAERLGVTTSVTYVALRGCPRLQIGRTHKFVWADVLDHLRARATGSSTPTRRSGVTGSSSTGKGAVFSMPHRQGGAG